VLALKDGKMYDENTGLVAPWMRQPDEFNDYKSDSHEPYHHQIGMQRNLNMNMGTMDHGSQLQKQLVRTNPHSQHVSYNFDHPSSAQRPLSLQSSRIPLSQLPSLQYGNNYKIQPGQSIYNDHILNDNGRNITFNDTKSAQINRSQNDSAIYEKFQTGADLGYSQYNYSQKIADRPQVGCPSLLLFDKILFE